MTPPAAPLISLVTPTLNQASTIRETIESVLRQDYPNFEYRVLDGGSQDGTLDILRDYDGEARFSWISEPDRGQSDAINKGLAWATGDFFNWLNSDDYLAPGALGAVAEAARRHPSADIISGTTVEFRGSPSEVVNETRLELRARPEASITVGVFCQPSTFWRTAIFRELGGVDPALYGVMDWHLWVRYLALHGQDRVVRLDRRLAYFRHHAQAKTSLGSNRFYTEAAAIFHELLVAAEAPQAWFELEGDPPAAALTRKLVLGPRFDRPRYLAAYAERMVRVYRNKNPALAKKWLRQAFTYKPWITFWRMKMALRLWLRKSAKTA